MVLLTSVFIVGCTNNEVEQDLRENMHKHPRRRCRAGGSKSFYPRRPEEMSIRSENSQIRKLSLIALEYDPDNDELLEKELLKRE